MSSQPVYTCLYPADHLSRFISAVDAEAVQCITDPRCIAKDHYVPPDGAQDLSDGVPDEERGVIPIWALQVFSYVGTHAGHTVLKLIPRQWGSAPKEVSNNDYWWGLTEEGPFSYHPLGSEFISTSVHAYLVTRAMADRLIDPSHIRIIPISRIRSKSIASLCLTRRTRIAPRQRSSSPNGQVSRVLGRKERTHDCLRILLLSLCFSTRLLDPSCRRSDAGDNYYRRNRQRQSFARRLD